MNNIEHSGVITVEVPRDRSPRGLGDKLEHPAKCSCRLFLLAAIGNNFQLRLNISYL